MNTVIPQPRPLEHRTMWIRASLVYEFNIYIYRAWVAKFTNRTLRYHLAWECIREQCGSVFCLHRCIIQVKLTKPSQGNYSSNLACLGNSNHFLVVIVNDKHSVCTDFDLHFRSILKRPSFRTSCSELLMRFEEENKKVTAVIFFYWKVWYYSDWVTQSTLFYFALSAVGNWSRRKAIFLLKVSDIKVNIIYIE